MPNTELEIKLKQIPFSTSQQNDTIDGKLGNFRGLKIFSNTEIPNPDPTIKKDQLYDFAISTTEPDVATSSVTVESQPAVLIPASGTITLTSVQVGDTVQVNGLIYTAVNTGTNTTGGFAAGAGDDQADAVELRKAIRTDTRTATVPGGIVTGFSGNVIDIFATIPGTVGNAITLVQISGTMVTSGSGTLTGGIDADFVIINNLKYTAVNRSVPFDFTQFHSQASDSDTAADLNRAINGDSRKGFFGDVSATVSAAVVTLSQTKGGTGGNTTPITTSDDAVLNIPAGNLFTGGGATGPVTVNIASRSVEISEKIGDNPIKITGFFTGLLNDTTSTFHAIPKVEDAENIEYDLFYTAVGTGSITVDLFVVSVEAPEGLNAPIFPVLPNSIDPIQIEVVQRTSTGKRRVYDYFMISTQT